MAIAERGELDFINDEGLALFNQDSCKAFHRTLGSSKASRG
jgi:hypothetical protein